MVEHVIAVEDHLKEGARLVLLGSQNALTGLSQMVDQEIEMNAVSAWVVYFVSRSCAPPDTGG